MKNNIILSYLKYYNLYHKLYVISYIIFYTIHYILCLYVVIPFYNNTHITFIVCISWYYNDNFCLLSQIEYHLFGKTFLGSKKVKRVTFLQRNIVYMSQLSKLLINY